MLGYTKEDQERVGYPEGTKFREENLKEDLVIPLVFVFHVILVLATLAILVVTNLNAN